MQIHDKIKLKSQWEITMNPSEWLKWKKMTLSFAEDVKQLEVSSGGGSNINWYNHFGRLFGNVYQSWKISYQYSNCTPKYILPKKCMYVHQKTWQEGSWQHYSWYKNLRTQMSINTRMGEYTEIFLWWITGQQREWRNHRCIQCKST